MKRLAVIDLEPSIVAKIIDALVTAREYKDRTQNIGGRQVLSLDGVAVRVAETPAVALEGGQVPKIQPGGYIGRLGGEYGRE